MELLAQLAVSVLLIVIVTLIHGTGVVLTTALVRLERRPLAGQRLAVREFTLMVPMALCLFFLHAIEIGVFAAFYMAAGEAETLKQALHTSAVAYTTLGVHENATDRWELVVAFEALAGFLLIGWSAAVFVTDMEKVLRRRGD